MIYSYYFVLIDPSDLGFIPHVGLSYVDIVYRFSKNNVLSLNRMVSMACILLPLPGKQHSHCQDDQPVSLLGYSVFEVTAEWVTGGRASCVFMTVCVLLWGCPSPSCA